MPWPRVPRTSPLRALALVAAVVVVAIALFARVVPGSSDDPDRDPSGSLVAGAPPAPVGPGDRVGAGVPAEQTLPTLFRISSFNLLGFGHTTPDGNRDGWADGRTRMRWQLALLAERQVDVVGFQEFQPQQFEVLRDEAGDEWAVYPGNQLTTAAMHNSIAWRRDTWRLVERQTIPIPYFGGNRIRMPYLRLRHRVTGQEAWFANFHNPANARGDAERWRDEATRLEVALVNRLRTETGLPVFVTGDMNERDEYFCRMTRNAPMQAANGGSNGPAGCKPPSPMAVDWIFGPVEVAFSNYVADRSPAVRRTTDHPLVVADALVPPRVAVNSCRVSPVPC